MAPSTTAAATIVVTPKNAADVALSALTTAATVPLTVAVSGPGTVAVATNLAGITSLDAGTGRAITGTTGHYVIGVFADGTAGVSTITISTGTTVLATETVTFYGAAAKITPTVVNSVLKIGANTGAITAVVTDAAERLAPTVTLEDATLTHLPDSVCVAVSTSEPAKVDTVADHVPPTPTVAVPIEELLRITLIDAPLTPVPVTVVLPEQYVPVIAGVALGDTQETKTKPAPPTAPARFEPPFSLPPAPPPGI
jgi:hypothetical protein